MSNPKIEPMRSSVCGVWVMVRGLVSLSFFDSAHPRQGDRAGK